MTSARHQRHGRTAVEGDLDRARFRGVRTWALAAGLPADPGALELIHCAKAARAATPDDIDRWTIVDVEALVWVELVRVCNERHQPIPELLSETLWTYLGYLVDSGAMVAPSDTLATLRSPLMAYGGLGANGRRGRQPSPPRSKRQSIRRDRGRQPNPAPIAAAPTAVAAIAAVPDPAAGDETTLAPIIPLRPFRARLSLAGS